MKGEALYQKHQNRQVSIDDAKGVICGYHSNGYLLLMAVTKKSETKPSFQLSDKSEVVIFSNQNNSMGYMYICPARIEK